MIENSQIFDALKVKEKGFLKFYHKFKMLLDLPKMKPQMLEETKSHNFGVNLDFKREDNGVKGEAMEQDAFTCLHSMASSAPSSEMAVVASSRNEQVDKRRAETLNFSIKTYASLVFTFVLDPLASLGTIKSMNSPTCSTIELQEVILNSLNYFDNNADGIDSKQIKQAIELKSLILAPVSTNSILQSKQQTKFIDFLDSKLKLIKDKITTMKKT